MIPGELLRWQTEHDITHNCKQTAFNLSGWRIGGNWWTKHFLYCSCLSLFLPLLGVIYAAMAQALQSGPPSAVVELEVSLGSQVPQNRQLGAWPQRDAQFWAYIAKIVLPPPRRQQAGDWSHWQRAFPAGTWMLGPQQVLCLCQGAWGSLAALKAPPKQNSPSLLLSQQRPTGKTRGRFSLWSDSTSSKKHTAV